jgi:hypothetical protein
VNVLRAWLARPLGWFTFVFAEYAFSLLLLRALAAVLPADLPVAVGLVLLAAIIVGLFVLNLWIRRRLADPDRDR